jgi:hypothetical protein
MEGIFKQLKTVTIQSRQVNPYVSKSCAREDGSHLSIPTRENICLTCGVELLAFECCQNRFFGCCRRCCRKCKKPCGIKCITCNDPLPCCKRVDDPCCDVDNCACHLNTSQALVQHRISHVSGGLRGEKVTKTFVDEYCFGSLCVRETTKMVEERISRKIGVHDYYSKNWAAKSIPTYFPRKYPLTHLKAPRHVRHYCSLQLEKKDEFFRADLPHSLLHMLRGKREAGTNRYHGMVTGLWGDFSLLDSWAEATPWDIVICFPRPDDLNTVVECRPDDPDYETYGEERKSDEHLNHSFTAQRGSCLTANLLGSNAHSCVREYIKYFGSLTTKGPESIVETLKKSGEIMDEGKYYKIRIDEETVGYARNPVSYLICQNIGSIVAAHGSQPPVVWGEIAIRRDKELYLKIQKEALDKWVAEMIEDVEHMQNLSRGEIRFYPMIGMESFKIPFEDEKVNAWFEGEVCPVDVVQNKS